jgi:hypothetical protein
VPSTGDTGRMRVDARAAVDALVDRRYATASN